jgi:hypothetical protein
MRLLYKNKNNIKKTIIPEAIKTNLCRDLELERLAKLLGIGEKETVAPMYLLDLMTSDPDDLKYRQEISRDLFDNRELYSDIMRIYYKMLGLLEIAEDKTSVMNKEINNHTIIINWIQHYCTVISELEEILTRHSKAIKAEAFIRLKGVVRNIKSTDEFEIISKNTKRIINTLGSIKSVKFGVNLNGYLEPVSINCLKANSYLYHPKKMLDAGIREDTKIRGIGKFKYIPQGKKREGEMWYDDKIAPTKLVKTTRIQRIMTCQLNLSLVNSLDSFFKTLNFNRRNAVKKFIVRQAAEIFELIDDLEFFLGGVGLFIKLADKRMPVCLAEIGSKGSGVYKAEALYNCYLPFIINKPSEEVVCNKISFGDNETFSILNGPNKGGKTTFLQAMGTCLILFQLGLHSPCKTAVIAPADMLLTHYQREERGSRTGRLEKEAESIRYIFSHLTKDSLVFFNEPYVSTSPSEGMFLILSMLKAVRFIGCRGILVTHYHKLNDQVETENLNNDRKIMFMNMGIDIGEGKRRRTYELIKGRGEVKSYALDILKEYAPELIK